jgi:hypothetical protein
MVVSVYQEKNPSGSTCSRSCTKVLIWTWVIQRNCQKNFELKNKFVRRCLINSITVKSVNLSICKNVAAEWKINPVEDDFWDIGNICKSNPGKQQNYIYIYKSREFQSNDICEKKSRNTNRCKAARNIPASKELGTNGLANLCLGHQLAMECATRRWDAVTRTAGSTDFDSILKFVNKVIELKLLRTPNGQAIPSAN